MVFHHEIIIAKDTWQMRVRYDSNENLILISIYNLVRFILAISRCV